MGHNAPRVRTAESINNFAYYLNNPDSLAKLFSDAKTNDLYRATLYQLCDYVADNTEDYRRAFLMAVPTIKDIQTAVKILTNPEYLERVCIYDRQVSGIHGNDVFEFFLSQEAEVPGVKSFTGNSLPYYFCATSFSILAATYTPPSGGGALNSLTAEQRQEQIKILNYALLGDAVALNGEFQLSIGGVPYIERARMRKLGDNYRTDKDRGEAPIDRHDIASLGAVIKANIKTEKVALPSNRVFELCIYGVKLRQ